MVRNFLDIVTKGLLMDGPIKLMLWIALALSFSALFWWICTHYTKLWNKRYDIKPNCKVICSIAAAITFITVLSFIGLKNTKTVAETMVQRWENAVVDNNALQDETFVKAYEAVASSGLESMAGYPHPSQGGNLIPMRSSKTLILTSTIYASEACENFHHSHPFLGWFLKADKGVPSEIITADLDAFFTANPGATYPLRSGFNIGVRHISAQLQEQTPRIVSQTRVWLVMFFLVVQLIPFGIIGFLAYKDLFRPKEKEETNEYSDNFDFGNI